MLILFQGKWKTKQGIHTSNLIMFVNRMKKFSISQDYNSQRGNANINMLLPGETTVTIFAGLESNSEAAFKIAHSYLGGDQEDVKINVNLLGGQQMATTVVWRKEMGKELQSYAKWAIESFESPINIEFDVSKITAAVEEFSSAVLEDILQIQMKIDCHQIRTDIITLVKTVDTCLRGRPNINSHLLTYVLDCALNAIDFRLELFFLPNELLI